MSENFLVWVMIFLIGLLLGASVVRAPAMDVPTCSEVRYRANDYTLQQIRQMMRRYKLTAEQRAAIEACLSDKKK